MEQALGPLQVLERVLTEIDDLRAAGQLGRKQCARRLGDEHLTAVGSASDPRTADDVEPEVALFPEGWFAGMQTHSNLDLGFARPAHGAQRQLSREGATHGVPCARKREEQRVALSVDFGTVEPGVTLTTTVVAEVLGTGNKLALGTGCMVDQTGVIYVPNPENNCADATVKIVGKR